MSWIGTSPKLRQKRHCCPGTSAGSHQMASRRSASEWCHGSPGRSKEARRKIEGKSQQKSLSPRTMLPEWQQPFLHFFVWRSMWMSMRMSRKDLLELTNMDFHWDLLDMTNLNSIFQVLILLILLVLLRMFIEDNAQFANCGCGQAQSTGTCPEIVYENVPDLPGYSRMLYIESLIYIYIDH